MRFRSSVGAVREAFAQVRPFVPSSPSLSAYSGVLLRAEGSSSVFSLTGSDGDSTLTVTVPATDVADGQVLLSARPLISYLGTIDDDAQVDIEVVDGGDVKVTSAGVPSYTFRPIPTTFPVPQAAGTAPVAVDLTHLAAALAAVRPAVNRENGAVRVSSGPAGLTLHATDGYRLARVVLAGAALGSFTGVLTLQTLERAARLGATSVAVDARARLLTFATSTASFTARPIATPFPAVETVIDAAPPPVTGLDPAALSRCLARLSAVADQSPVRIRLEGSAMLLSASTAEIGTGAESVELSEPVPAPFEVMVRSSYLHEAVAVFTAGEVRLAYSGPVQPLFFSAPGVPEVLQVVMPVRG